MQKVGLSNTNHIFKVAQDVNHSGKEFYSACLDNKGNSSVGQTLKDGP